MAVHVAEQHEVSESPREEAAPKAAPTEGLRLASLTVNGFKSFADTTRFKFDAPISGIVGPNGCGKSNVVDAIKWVLGERSSKSLRGKEMIDVIFAGSAGRAPSGMAAVTLAFDNPVVERRANELLAPEPTGLETDEAAAEDRADTPEDTEPEAASLLSRRHRRALPIDSDTVEVERRLYRDGKSQYLINGRTARLRDIRELFMDTGIGADAYSIIEQGKVDRMLLSSPQERRVIFEEAAGVAKYKQRRIEAQRKLDRAEASLATTRQKLESTERRLRLVRGQATKARRFQELDAEYRALRLAAAYDEYGQLRRRLEGLTSQITQLEHDRDAARREVEQAESAQQEIEIERAALSDAHAKAEARRLAADQDARTAAHRAELAERSRTEAQDRTRDDEQRLATMATRAEALGQEASEHAERVASLASRAGEAERAESEASEARASLLERQAEIRTTIDGARRDREGIERRLAQIEAQAQGETRRIETLREQASSLETRASEIERERDGVEQRLRTARTESADTSARLASLTESLAATDEQAAALSGDRAARAERVTSLDEQQVRLETRRSTLEEMVRDRVGLGEAARAVLDRRDSDDPGGFEHVVGVLASLIEVDGEHAAAVESALGSLVGGLVVPSLAEMPGDASLRDLPGRAVFVPMRVGIEPGPPALPQSLSAAVDAGRLTRLRDHARADLRSLDAGARSELTPLIEGLLDRVLGRTFAVSDLDTAMLLNAGPLAGDQDAGCRFVTPEGSVLEPDGRVIAGPPDTEASAGVLQRRAELDDLARALGELNERLTAERTALARVDSEAAEIDQRRTALAHDVGETERHRVKHENAVERLAHELERLGRERDSAVSDARDVSERAASLDTERAELLERGAKLSALLDDAKTRIDALDGELTAANAQLESANDQLTAARVEARAVSEQHQGANQSLTRVRLDLDELSRTRDELGLRLDETRRVIVQHEQAIAEAGEAGERAERDRDAAAAQAGELGERLAALSDRVREAAAMVNDARKRAELIERDWQSVEVSRRELEVRRETTEERATDELGEDLGTGYDEYRAMIDEGGVSPVDPAAAAPLIKELRDAIRALGNVNLDAIEEETTLEEQNEELVRQVADIDDARARLSDLIARLNEASTSRFADVFERIRTHFGAPDGMFRQLFGGGQAEVRLMPLVKEVDGAKVETDDIDVLESGIEVIARPPGKQPRSISQLSGGEKTLTSVALLLSIFRSKPSCFCVLDEVDAALDEHNVGRFNDVIGRFTDLSRFIVITHNKRTMQSCDSLTGVTMQERGVSKRISVRLDQIKDDGDIDTRAAAATAPTANPEPEDQPTPAARPSDALRRGLAGMRSNAPAASDA